MTEYRRVLLVVDLTEDSLPIGRAGAGSGKPRWARKSTCCTWSNTCRLSPWVETLMPAVQIEDELLDRGQTTPRGARHPDRRTRPQHAE